MNRKNFLSRLLGGEDLGGGWQSITDFLSRLLGGEAISKFSAIAAVFLSRLLGGEGKTPKISDQE